MIKVSVIVPLHNSETYLEECIGSIAGQTLKEIEIICIDSSTDRTREILKAYQKRDARVRIIEDENSSYGYKLNTGIRIAGGKYICIVESDDYIEKNMLKDLYETAEKAQADFVKSDYKKFFHAGKGRKYKEIARSLPADYGRIINLKKENKRLDAYFCIWTGLYNRDFLLKNRIRAHESPGASYQDTGFSMLVCLLAEKVWFTSEPYYNYRIDNEGSSVKSNEKCLVITDEFSWIEKQMEQRGLEEPEEKSFFMINKIRSYFWNYDRLPKKYGVYFIDSIKDEIRIEYPEQESACYDETLYEQILILSGDRRKERQYRQEKQGRRECIKRIASLLCSSKEVVLFGAGCCGKTIAECCGWLDTNCIKAVCDNDKEKQGRCIWGIRVISPQQGVRAYPNAVYLTVSKKYAKEMAKQLIAEGIPEQQICAVNEELDSVIFFEQIAELYGGKS